MIKLPLVTERLTLTPLSSAHEGQLLALLNLPEVGRFLLDGETVGRPWVRQMIEDSDEAFRTRGVGLFLARDDDEGLVGLAGFRAFEGSEELQLLYAVHPSRQREGYASEMTRALVALALEELGCEEVSASTDAANVGSLKVLENLGMELVRRETGAPHEQLHEQLHEPLHELLHYRLRRAHVRKSR